MSIVSRALDLVGDGEFGVSVVELNKPAGDDLGGLAELLAVAVLRARA